MKTLERYILLELLLNIGVTFAAVVLLFLIFAIALVTQRADGAGMTFVMARAFDHGLWFLTLLVPFTILAGTIFTYGRLAADGEVAAAGAAGVPAGRLLLPAAAVGSAAMLLLILLADSAMPAGKFRARTLTREFIMDVESLMKLPSMEISEKSFKCHWKGRRRDAEGNLMLEDFYVLKLDEKGAKDRDYHAELARPVFHPRTREVTFHLVNCRFSTPEGVQRSGTLRVRVNVDRLIGESVQGRREREMSFEELLSGAARGTPRKARILMTEFWFRAAFAGAAFVFALLGAILGIRLRLANRTTVILVGFVTMAAVYYPLVMLGLSLSRDGRLPAPLALLLGNLALLALALVLGRKVVRA